MGKSVLGVDRKMNKFTRMASPAEVVQNSHCSSTSSLVLGPRGVALFVKARVFYRISTVDAALHCRQTSPRFSPFHFKTGTFSLMFEPLFLYLPMALAD